MEVKLERLEYYSVRVGLDPLSPPGSRAPRYRGKFTNPTKLFTLLLLALVTLAVTAPAAQAEEPSTLNSFLSGLLPGQKAEGARAEAARPVEKVESKDDGSSFEFGTEYLLALRAATSVWTGPVEQALSLLGTPYRLGGTSRKGIDCSGLIGLVFNHEGFSLPRTAAEQFRIGSPVEFNDLRAGDLVFFANTYKRGISHVGLYIGDGKFVHAENRRRGVVITPINETYYRSRFAGGRRLFRTPGDDLAAAADLRPVKKGVEEIQREDIALLK